ncbi:hypothetical protein DICSQDRAFT_137097 [Dichomitus squalens LYAD-421 SS1]|uniref:EamA domain-containing protein n=1 Tax=Dichomitus squalens (strain LYAD-421) TaxID=732165 RepID=R7SXQ3_DICSQ|nr:uncharacterized protein DICSQDRAFT_137097 [Dichomitus squalens LYAD-421 SS1]EJF60876.1 hypothetical protein DICSQDRAFT_137097 [Dichomitus squalens LYAD-421 SS1]
MPSTSRMPYAANTPDRSAFDVSIPLSPQVSYIPAPTTSDTADPTSSYVRILREASRYKRRAREVFESNIGLLLVASAQLFFSLMNVGVKQLNSLDPPVPAVELIFVRMAITWVCCVSYMHIMKVPDPFFGPKGIRWFLVQRGLFGFMGIFGLYYSLQYLSLSDATVLQFLSPIFTAVAGAIFLHETFSYRELLAGLTSLVGVVLIARPHFLFGATPNEAPTLPDDLMKRVPDAQVTPAQRLLAVGIALFGAVGAAGAYTTIRLIGKRAHALHNLVAYSMLCMIVTSMAMIALRIPVVVPMRWDWLLMLCFIGLAGFSGQVLLTMGLQRETAGRGSIAVYGQIVFATLFERIFLHTTPSPLSILGTVIIVGSALYVVLTKKTTPEDGARPTTSDDPSVEEGLLASHDTDEPEGDTIQSQTIVLADNQQLKTKVLS